MDSINKDRDKESNEGDVTSNNVSLSAKNVNQTTPKRTNIGMEPEKDEVCPAKKWIQQAKISLCS